MIGLQECGPAPPRAPASKTTREKTAQAVEYYNTHLQRARANAGLTAPRASYNDKHFCSNQRRHQYHHINPDLLYRSNSSLELLDHLQHPKTSKSTSPTLKREYGSHGSIDVIERPTPTASGPSESFFAMLQDYRPTVLGGMCTDQRSPGPSEYLRGNIEVTDGHSHSSQMEQQQNSMQSPQSPKLRVKLPRFWSSGTVSSNSAVKNQKCALEDNNVSISCTNVVVSAEAEEITRRRAFAHYDCQSLTTNLEYGVRIRRNLMSKRRNTTTGASAASMVGRSITPDGESVDEDYGDGQSNELLESCPFFRNEVGGEEERIVSLTRLQNTSKQPMHRPFLAYGVAVLEFLPGETHWRHSTCPYQRLPRPIESIDQGALYYRKHFYQQDHQNWFGIDEQLGPVAVSIRREKVAQLENQQAHSLAQFQYRLVIRTSELLTLRGAILEDAIPNIRASSSNKSHISTKEVLEYVAPEIQINCLKLGISGVQTEDQLLKLDEQGLTSHYKVGVMYCKAGQSSEEEMYNNEEAEAAFVEFLETIGKKVRLQGFDKYRAGLDSKTDSTGLYSMYAQYQECEVMFHVSTMLPFTPNNRQQLLRKRHIGNDIVTIVFQEPGALPFTPKGIRSQFQHVFIVVKAINPCTENTHYSVAVSRSKEVQPFGPPIKKGAVYPKGKAFAEFLLAKIVNAENAAHRSEKFVTMATRTRQEYLKEIVANFSSTTPVDTGQKFSLFGKKKEKIRLRFIPDICQRGAILWQVVLDDMSQTRQVECFLGVSADTLILIEELSRQIVFVTPCKSILGWSPQTNSLRIYHHQGECLTIHMRDAYCDRDELMEVVERLKAVTLGTKVEELSLKRNIMKQLGFHVQPDGIVTLVESSGPAAQAGLLKNSRLVEICKVAVSTLTYDQMVDLLKTSTHVTLTVIPPLPEGQPRKGCTLQNCKYNEGNYEGDYETNMDDSSKTRKAPQMQQAVPGNVKVYDRSFSPPRSSNSSGYGTGNSKKSFLGGVESKYAATNNEGTSSSSGHSNEERWLDLPDNIDCTLLNKSSYKVHNTYPSTPKRNMAHQLSGIQISKSHNQFPQSGQHNKVQSSHSLPLQHSKYSQPISAPQQGGNSSSDQESYKLNKNNLVKQQNDRMRYEVRDYMITKPPKIVDYPSLSQINVTDDHSTDSSISERLYGIGSEEELSNCSGNVSPRTRHAKRLNSLNSSRNQSPRSLNGEAKLRAGVTSRTSNRNSANITNNLQEELIRLISPDADDAPTPTNNDSMSSSSSCSKENNAKSRSRENINNGLMISTKPEVIYTTARPATVISNASTTSSPLPSDYKSNTIERLSPRAANHHNKVKLSAGTKAIPLPEDMDWSSLVDTANKVVGSERHHHRNNEVDDDEGQQTHWEESYSVSAGGGSSSVVPEEVRNHVTELESRVSRETRRRLSLEEEVRRLKDENKKLQDQAHAAIQQLRKFTEWFFKNVQSE